MKTDIETLVMDVNEWLERSERRNSHRFDAAQDAWDNTTPDDDEEGDPDDFIQPDDDDTDRDAEWGGMDI